MPLEAKDVQADYKYNYFIPDSLVTLNRSSAHLMDSADPNMVEFSINMMIEALINAKDRIKLYLNSMAIFRPVH